MRPQSVYLRLSRHLLPLARPDMTLTERMPILRLTQCSCKQMQYKLTTFTSRRSQLLKMRAFSTNIDKQSFILHIRKLPSIYDLATLCHQLMMIEKINKEVFATHGIG